VTDQATPHGSALAPTRPLGSPTRLDLPAFLLNPPFSYSTEVANNIWMEEYDEVERQPDDRRAMAQFLELYRHLASEALVHLLPTPRDAPLQDLVFTANLGIVLAHLDGEDVAVISNFTSEPRRGETKVGVDFFTQMGYATYVSPHRFEGEAELKHLHDNVYVGGYGQRSEKETYQWMAEAFGMVIPTLAHDDPYLYHLDCTVFPLTREETLVCTAMYDRVELAAIERHTNIIDVSYDECFGGICNSVRLGNTLLNASSIQQLQAGTEDYALEVAKNRRLEDLAVERAFEVSYFDLGEYMKGGALLSCMVMHLNRHSYAIDLV
jgi:N-dimethylarginine dimethylaminohydrolase